MNKLAIILSIFILICASCTNQKPKGCYFDDCSTSFVCIKNDSIAIGFKRSISDGLCYFYGTYNQNHDTIKLDKNLLRHENASVDTIYTDYPGIEIQFYELYPKINLGAPTENYSTFYQLAKDCIVWWNYDLNKRGFFFNNPPNIKTDDGIIQIPMDTALYHCSRNHEFLIHGYSIFTEQVLEIKPHTRYIIKQKDENQNHRPMYPLEGPIVYNTKKNQIEITESVSTNYQPPRTYQLKYIGSSDSCLGELRKIFPDL